MYEWFLLFDFGPCIGLFFLFFFFIHGAPSVSKTEVTWDMSGGVGRL